MHNPAWKILSEPRAAVLDEVKNDSQDNGLMQCLIPNIPVGVALY